MGGEKREERAACYRGGRGKEGTQTHTDTHTESSSASVMFPSLHPAQMTHPWWLIERFSVYVQM